MWGDSVEQVIRDRRNGAVGLIRHGIGFAGQAVAAGEALGFDYGDAQCSASRAYDDPAKPVLLAIIPSPDGDTFELLVAYKSQYDRFADEFDGFVDFGSGPMKVPLLQYGSKDKTMTFYQFRLAADQMARGRRPTPSISM